MPIYKTGDRAVVPFESPVFGVLRNRPIHAVPLAGLWSAQNILVRDGVLQPRPGLTEFAAFAFTGRPTGLFPYRTAGDTPTPVLATTTRFYSYISGAWSDKTGALLTASPDQVARFAGLVFGTPAVSYVVHVNGKDVPQQWDGSVATFSAVVGSPPTFSDVATINDRIVGIIPPYLVRWGQPASLSTWPSLNFKQMGETPDECIAVRALGAVVGVVYKSRSVWRIVPTGAQSDAGAFRFELAGFFDGPAGPSAVVDLNGVHMYMTPTGRVGLFDGLRHQWVADGIWPLIRGQIDSTTVRRITGWYDPTRQETTFAYPRTGDGGDPKGLVTVIWPDAAAGRPSFASFPGVLGVAASAATTIRLTDNVDRVLIATAVTSKSYEWKGTTDAGTVIDGHWQTGLAPTPDADVYRAESVETLAERANGYGQLTLFPYSAYSLGSVDGTKGPSVLVNLGDDKEPIRALTGPDVRGRFLGLRYEFSDAATVTLRYKGATLTALRRTA